jgi:protein-S-isoprenylcysteine O-methyltransferase Ste14
VSFWRQLRAIGLLPGMVTVVVPTFVVAGAGANVGWDLAPAPAALTMVAGLALLAAGLTLMFRTVSLFATVGRGTLAPWDPPSRLVVRGPYRHLRHPMISGVLCVLLGEATLLGVPALYVWFACVATVNAIYLPLIEEPSLVRRFGAEYETYRANVPRWFPRRRPWEPGADARR